MLKARMFHTNPKEIFDQAENGKAVIMHEHRQDYVFVLKAIKKDEYLRNLKEGCQPKRLGSGLAMEWGALRSEN